MPGTLLLWAPRILGLLVAGFLSLFALDAVREGPAALLMHLAPALFLLVAIAVSWRRAWVGAAVFITLGVAYAAMTPHRVDWILTISGPLLVVGALFFWSWRRRPLGAG